MKELWRQNCPGQLRVTQAGGVLTAACLVEEEAKPLLYDHGFERGDLSGFFWNYNAPVVVTAPHPVREGTRSMRSYLHRTKSTHKQRTDCLLAVDRNMPPDQKNESFTFTIGKEYWIGLSIYLDPAWVVDPPNMDEVLFQCQATPDTGETWRQPVFMIGVEQDQWRLWSKWDTRALTPASLGTANWSGTKLWSFPLRPSLGRWTDWVIHVKWSWKADGFLQVWQNGVTVVEAVGPNCSNDKLGPQVSFGVYKWEWKPDHNPPYTTNSVERLVYHDALRIGGANSSYADVAPRGVK